MNDTTECIRRALAADIASDVTSNNPQTERQRLEKEYGVGNVFDTKQLSTQFEVIGFMAPFCVVREKASGKKGSVQFQHNPRLYFGFQAD